jgi:exodeoxyribonuclease VII small subunit
MDASSGGYGTTRRTAFFVDRNPLIELDLLFSCRGGVRMPNSAKTQNSQSFESALAELEKIVSSMEAGQMPLEKSLAAYKRGAELLKYCQTALQDAQQQVKILEGNILQDFKSDSADNTN